MSFEEFAAVYDAYVTQRNIDIKGAWERMRIQAMISIQPYLKDSAGMTPEKLIPLSWDDEKHEAPATERSPEEQRKRARAMFEKLKERTKKDK